MNADKIDKVIDELHINEKKVLKGLESAGLEAIPEEIVESQKMNIKAVMSAAGILESRGLIEVQKDEKNVISLTDDGKQYAQEGLPERKLLKSLGDKKWAKINQGIVEITPEGLDSLNIQSDDEQVLDKLLDAQKILMDPTKIIKDSFNLGFNLLKQRKGIINVKKDSQYLLKVTDDGKAVINKGIDLTYTVSQLTHEQLKTGSWKSLKFRSYDINAEHPETFPGKIHPLTRIIEEIRDVFLNMGFTESKGNILESAFWNFDCLFQPQDHAAREMQDTFYIKNPQYSKLPDDDIVNRVKDVHEHGGNTGSEGWNYAWDREVAKQSVLRTHTTCVSARFLEEFEPPLKMFSVGRVFRREP